MATRQPKKPQGETTSKSPTLARHVRRKAFVPNVKQAATLKLPLDFLQASQEAREQATSSPFTMPAKVKSSTQMAPPSRQRVKSLQSVLKSFDDSGTGPHMQHLHQLQLRQTAPPHFGQALLQGKALNAGAAKSQRATLQKMATQDAEASRHTRKRSSHSLEFRPDPSQGQPTEGHQHQEQQNLQQDFGQQSLSQASSSAKEKHIKMMVRVRPTLSSENAKQCISLQNEALLEETKDKIQEAQSVIRLTKGYHNVSFKFDQVLPEGCSQERAFLLSSAQIVSNFVAHGSSATIFAYGQTGAGKTYTIIGGGQASRKKERSGGQRKPLKLSSSEKKGILPRIIDNLFSLAQAQVQARVPQSYAISFYEIYNDKVFDLLKAPSFSPQNSNGSKEGGNSATQAVHRDSLDVRAQKDGNFVIANLKKVVVKTRQESYIWLEKGLHNRQICATSQNAASSRSHTIFQIEAEHPSGSAGSVSRLRIVDLAGSEKYCYSNKSQDIKMKELSSINQSLSTLGQCISALGDSQRRHIPFRNCKLTKILKDSLMQPTEQTNHTIVALIICISPSVDSYQETQSTLQFADRAKKAILNKATPLGSSQQTAQTPQKVSATLLDNMATEMEKLRRENAELKSHLRGMRHSSSQGSLTHVPTPQTQAHPQAPMQALEADQHPLSIDLRLSEVLQGADDTIMEEEEPSLSGPQQERRPRKESSPAAFHLAQSDASSDVPMDDQQEPLAPWKPSALRSCLKGSRARESAKQQARTSAATVIFKEVLDNDASLNESIRERIEHNLAYNDDRIFDNLEIFQDIGETNNKVHGSKDKFNARSLLSTPIDQIPVSDEEDQEEEEEKPAQAEDKSEDLVESGEAKRHQPVLTKVIEKDMLIRPQRVEQVSLPPEPTTTPVKQPQQSSADSPLPQPQKQSVQSQEPESVPVEAEVQRTSPMLRGGVGGSVQDFNPGQMPDFSQSNIHAQSFLQDMSALNEEEPMIQMQQDTLNLSNDLSNDLIELGNDKQFQAAFAEKDSSLELDSGLKRGGRAADQEENILIQDDFLNLHDSGSREAGRREQDDSLPLSSSIAFGAGDNQANLSNILEQSLPFPKQTHKEGDKARPDPFNAPGKFFLNDMSNILQIEEQATQKSQDPVCNADSSQQLQNTLIFDDFKNAQHGSSAGLDRGRSGLDRERDEPDRDQDQMVSFDASRILPSPTPLNMDSSHLMVNRLVSQLLEDEPDSKQLPQPTQPAKHAQDKQQRDLSKFFAQKSHNLAPLPVPADSSQPLRDEALAQSLTNTFSTIQSLSNELNAIRSNLEKQQQPIPQNRLGAPSRQPNSQAGKKRRPPDSRPQASEKPLTKPGRTAPRQSPLKPQSQTKVVEETKDRDAQVPQRPLSSLLKFSASPRPIPKSASDHLKHKQQSRGGAMGAQTSRPLASKAIAHKFGHHQAAAALPFRPRQAFGEQEQTGQFKEATPLCKIVAGERIEQLRGESTFEGEESLPAQNESDLATEQSTSLELGVFARDLHTYYSKIHSEIAQLKHLLLQSQSQSKHAATLEKTSPERGGIRQAQLAQTQRPTQSANQPFKSPHLASQDTRIDSDAIQRAQTLIEQIKAEIISALKRKAVTTRPSTLEPATHLNDFEPIAQADNGVRAIESVSPERDQSRLLGDLVDQSGVSWDDSPRLGTVPLPVNSLAQEMAQAQHQPTNFDFHPSQKLDDPDLP